MERDYLLWLGVVVIYLGLVWVLYELLRLWCNDTDRHFKDSLETAIKRQQRKRYAHSTGEQKDYRGDPISSIMRDTTISRLRK